MTDRVLLTADRHNFEDCLDLARTHGLGVELMNFAYPDVLDGSWQNDLAVYQSLLRDLPGPVTLHGPFYDMASGSLDARIENVIRQRYHHAIHIAGELEAELIVFHANFIGALHNTAYRDGWHQRNVAFWREMVDFAADKGVVVALENMWEFDPTILSDLLAEIAHPALRTCLDVGHVRVFSEAAYTLSDWISALQPWLVHTHMNNNNGKIDEHHGFDWPEGVLDYHEILPLFRKLPHPPNIVLEMTRIEDMRASLPYLELESENETLPTDR